MMAFLCATTHYLSTFTPEQWQKGKTKMLGETIDFSAGGVFALLLINYYCCPTLCIFFLLNFLTNYHNYLEIVF
jgi:hypothetical protein